MKALWQWLSGVLGWLWERGWSEPARSRGHLWVFILWVRVALAFCMMGTPLAPYFIAYLAFSGWHFLLNHQPRRLGKHIPSLRR